MIPHSTVEQYTEKARRHSFFHSFEMPLCTTVTMLPVGGVHVVHTGAKRMNWHNHSLVTVVGKDAGEHGCS